MTTSECELKNFDQLYEFVTGNKPRSRDLYAAVTNALHNLDQCLNDESALAETLAVKAVEYVARSGYPFLDSLERLCAAAIWSAKAYKKVASSPNVDPKDDSTRYNALKTNYSQSIEGSIYFPWNEFFIGIIIRQMMIPVDTRSADMANKAM